MTSRRRYPITVAEIACKMNRTFPVVLLLAACLHPGPVIAEWRIDPILRVAWDYDDNATLSARTDNQRQISGYIGEASANFFYDAEQGFFSVEPAVRTRDYGSDSDLNSDDQFLRLMANYSGERNLLSIFGDFSREAVRTAELADADLDTEIDPDDIADDESGQNDVGLRTRRERYRISPRWSYRFSSISSIDADFNYLTVAYDETQGPIRLFDYTDMRFRLAYRRSFSLRNSASLSATVRDFDTDRFGGDRKTYGLSAGFVRTLSETAQFRASAGIESFDEDDALVSTLDTDPQFVFGVSVVHRLKTIRLLAQYRQRVNATGRGGLTRRNELDLRLTRDLNDRFSAGIGIRAYNDSTVSGGSNEQTYIQLRGSVIWRLSRAFFMQADYRNTTIDREVVGEAADANQITVWLTYQPSPIGPAPNVRLDQSTLRR